MRKSRKQTKSVRKTRKPKKSMKASVKSRKFRFIQSVSRSPCGDCRTYWKYFLNEQERQKNTGKKIIKTGQTFLPQIPRGYLSKVGQTCLRCVNDNLNMAERLKSLGKKTRRKIDYSEPQKTASDYYKIYKRVKEYENMYKK